ncbi:MAG TPA: circularly permuted type 2 ATP-grasp protein [Acidimicrobiales bacterium]|nr:circularly permuted type 2 ATP-grasp protein [Acidimicrobiales bacterium]
MADLFDDYDAATAWDEMFEPTGAARAPYRALHDALQPLSSVDLDERAAARDRAFRDQGITFSLSGEERPFPLDLVPRILSAAEWATIESGVIQRVRALEAFLADIYGNGRILDDGVVPRRLVTSSNHFHRQAHGITPPNGVRVHVAGVDLVRDEAGRFCVLEDNLRTPSGISYVVENRRTMARVFPELFATHRVRPVSGYPARLLEALRAAAPKGVTEPTVVVLTPGVYNAAYFEHSFLARQMGVELVEGRDLVCRDNVVSMRTTDGEQRVDVVYRRIDDDFLDPLHFRPDSIVGCPGLMNAARAGTVTVANAVGNGVADDKLLATYVPAIIEYYLDEEAILPNIETYRLGDDGVLPWVLERLDELVLKPVDGSGGYGIVIGPQADDETLGALAVTLQANPRNWIAQRVVTLSTSPTQVGERLRPRHIDLRPFAVNDGSRIWVVPGGLTRVALPEGSLIVNSSQGGGSKDTWVLAGAGRATPPRGVGADSESDSAHLLPPSLPTKEPDPGPGNAAAAQMQQQQQGPGGPHPSRTQDREGGDRC